MMRTITVKGVGSIPAKPDYITLSLSIESKGSEYDAAMEKAAKRIEQLETAAADLGFEKGNLKTTSFHVTTDYENVKDHEGNYQRKFAGYICSYRLKLSFDFDSKLLAAVLSSISSCGASPELRIAFTVKNPAKVSEELLTSATMNAREKAEILCRAAGAELGQLVTIDYNWGELNVLSRTQYEVEDCVQPRMAMSKCCAPEIEPDAIAVSDTASFVWELN